MRVALARGGAAENLVASAADEDAEARKMQRFATTVKRTAAATAVAATTTGREQARSCFLFSFFLSLRFEQKFFLTSLFRFVCSLFLFENIDIP